MIRLHTLGAIDLRDESGREVRAVLAQPKRLAMLAYLAAASPRGSHRRDILLGLFWPELDQDHARNALSKAVHFLRRSLGESALVSRSADDLGLDGALVWSDVAAFGAAWDGNRTEEALGLYRGDLLPSFFIPDAPGFEQWLEQERASLRLRASEAARLRAEWYEAGGDAAQAIECARRAVALPTGTSGPCDAWSSCSTDWATDPPPCTPTTASPGDSPPSSRWTRAPRRSRSSSAFGRRCRLGPPRPPNQSPPMPAGMLTPLRA
jgi:serine/threonine-protein kinase